ncbi:MAG: Zn-ribbon domain-containing OB-fold protein [Candidatus ainarchaeum sp.]|nr:Zn-ribbon domain-containing OB-fold protein [Candidatus ainarchaeum sp.]
MKSSISLTWRRIPERYRLEGNECINCKTAFFPPRNICPKCRRKGILKPKKFSGKGSIYSYTEIDIPPEGFENQAPYVLAIIDLVEGSKILGQIVDARLDEVRVGSKVEHVFRMIQKDDPEGLIHYGFKFKLVK